MNAHSVVEDKLDNISKCPGESVCRDCWGRHA